MKRVIVGLSGGVDSSVAAVLIHEAIGDQLTCVFVDHGLLRQGEAEEVVKVVPSIAGEFIPDLQASDTSFAVMNSFRASPPRATAAWVQRRNLSMGTRTDLSLMEVRKREAAWPGLVERSWRRRGIWFLFCDFFCLVFWGFRFLRYVGFVLKQCKLLKNHIVLNEHNNRSLKIN